jgi:hypothetical protein
MTGTDAHIALVEAMAAWGWPGYFRSLPQDALLVFDADLRAAFDARYGTPPCHVATPQKAEQAAVRHGGPVLLLCRQGERRLTARLRRAYPDRAVISCTYDLAPLGASKPTASGLSPSEQSPSGLPTSGLPVPGAIQPGQIKVPDTGAVALVVLSTPYSDAEYLGGMLSENGLGTPRELFGPAVTSLALYQTDFEPTRFLFHALAAEAKDNRIALHLQSDVLLPLVDAGVLSWTQVAGWLRRADAPVLYFSRRDKMVQCCIAAALDAAGVRSAWAMDRAARAGGVPSPSAGALQNWLYSLLIQEDALEAFLEKAEPEFRSVTLEELVESPVEVLKSLAIFLGGKLRRDLTIAKYGVAYAGLDGIAGEAAAFRERLISDLGLVRNQAGSLVSRTDALLGKKADE